MDKIKENHMRKERFVWRAMCRLATLPRFVKAPIRETPGVVKILKKNQCRASSAMGLFKNQKSWRGKTHAAIGLFKNQKSWRGEGRGIIGMDGGGSDRVPVRFSQCPMPVFLLFCRQNINTYQSIICSNVIQSYNNSLNITKSMYVIVCQLIKVILFLPVSLIFAAIDTMTYNINRLIQAVKWQNCRFSFDFQGLSNYPTSYTILT